MLENTQYWTISSQLPKPILVRYRFREYTGKLKMNSSNIKQSVLAMMFGDAFTDTNFNSGKARLEIYHCEDQYEYLLKKKDILENISGITCNISVKTDNRILSSGLTRKGYRLQTNFSRYFFNLVQTPNKFKLKQLVKPEALAILWQDDGTLIFDKKGHFSTAVLATDSWDKTAIDYFIQQFNKLYGWSPVIMQTHNKGKIVYKIRFTKDKAILLSNIIKPYISTCLNYKVFL